MENIYSIKNKVIVITGATGYLGSKMVEHLNKAGAKVIILSTTLEKAIKLCEDLDIEKDQAYEIDLTSKKNIKNVFFKIYKNFGKIDILVNNAHFGVNKKFNEYTKDEWCRSLEGTIISTDRVVQEVIPYMKKNNIGRIINISSMYGIVSPNPEIYSSEEMINPLSYGVGKAGMIQYTKYIAMRLAQYNITVNSISYGPFPNIHKVKDLNFISELANKTFVKRIGRPEEVTSAVYFLSLDESSYITGHNLIVDGGWTSW